MLRKMYFAVLSAIIAGVSQAHVSDDFLDFEMQTANYTRSEVSPVEMAPFLLDETYQDWVAQVHPRVVGLRSSKGLPASGVILDVNDLQQPLVLTTAGMIEYDLSILNQVKEVYLDHPRGERKASIIDEKHVVVLPSDPWWNTRITQGWYGLPVFHPRFLVNEATLLRDSGANFGIFVMTGRSVKVDIHQPRLYEQYTVKESLAAGFTDSRVREPMVADVSASSEVLVMGQARYLKPNPVFERFSAAGLRQRLSAVVPEWIVEEKMSYSFGEVLSNKESEKISQKYNLNLSSQNQFFVRGEFDPAMEGAGVFNQKGALVGLVTRVVTVQTTSESQDISGVLEQVRARSRGVVVLKIESVLSQTARLSQQKELLKVIGKIQRNNQMGLCRHMFSPVR